MKICLFNLLLLFSYVHASYDLGDIIVSSRSERVQNEFSSNTQTIDLKLLSTQISVIESIKNTPGVDIIQNGGPGSSTSISIRGSERRHVLVLINGVRMSDRSDLDGGFDLKLIPKNMIEKIEILSGSQTLLYGSDAMGGVVNIITKNYTPKNSVKLTLGGIKNSETQNSIMTKNLSFFISGFYEESKLISSSSNGSELDGYNQKGIYTNLNYTYSNDLSSELIIKHDINNSMLDKYDFGTGKTEDADISQLTYNNFISHKFIFEQNSSKIDFIVSSNKISRYEIAAKKELFEGKENSSSFSFLNKMTTYDFLTLVDYSFEEFSQSGEEKVTNEQIGLAQSIVYKHSNYLLDFGSRYTKNLTSGENISSSFGIKSNSLGVQFSQGFKTPSLYQLKGRYLGALVGNSSLKPERVNSLNMTYDYEYLSLVAFYNRYFDLIDFSTNYENINDFESHGLGLSYSLKLKDHQIAPSVDFLSYNSFASRVNKRPNQIYRLNYFYHYSDQIKFSMNYRYRGLSYEFVNNENERIEASSTINMGLEKKMNSYDWSFKVSNLFDDPNHTTFGYNGSPRIYEVSLKYSY